MTPGILPSAPSGPAPLFAPLLRRSAPKSNQKGLGAERGGLVRILFESKQPSMERDPARTSLCGRSRARDAFHRISRQIPARPCASRRRRGRL